MRDEELWILIDRAMRCIRIEDQLCIREPLVEVEGINGVDNNVRLAIHYKRWLFDLPEICEALAVLIAPLRGRGKLSLCDLLGVFNIAIFGASIAALEKGTSGSHALSR